MTVLHVHRAERADPLVAMLGDVMARPLPDPMVAEVVAVPTRGVERWLAQQLATSLGAGPGRGDGVCANIAFPFPGTLVGRGLAAASGIDPNADPWSPPRLVWPLVDVVDAHLDEPWLAPLAAHIRGAGPAEATRRLGAVRHVADLFDRYDVHRPAMVRAWAAGDDLGADGGPLPPDAVWQPCLWRSVRDRVAVPSPAERLPDACRRLRDEPGIVEMPDRVSLFGLTRLPASYLDVLAAIAARRDVHLFLLHPSPVLWDRVAADAATAGDPRRRAGDPTSGRLRHRADDPTTAAVVNPLLASWGRDAREMQMVLRAAGSGSAVDHHRSPGFAAGTLLGRIQADIRADRAPAGLPVPGRTDARAGLDPRDRSISVHACHGRGRQVEVLRDAIWHLLAEDPTLEPRDVIVMCPDIETYAPLIHAIFDTGRSAETGGANTGDTGTGDTGGGEDENDARLPELRVRLADRSLRQTNPVLGVVATLLELAVSRVTASQVLDLAGREPVARRFGFDPDDLGRMEQWVAGTGIRWGFDGVDRARFRLAGLEAGTWRSGLDRTLLGAAMADTGQRRVAGVVPLDDVDSGDIRLAGRFAELVSRLEGAVAAFAAAKPIAAWADAIATAADMLCATSDADAWQRAQLQGLLDEVVGEATSGDATSEATLVLAEVASLLGDRLRGRPTRANFRTGQLTICTLVPMRSVPHRVVCLLGLDDGVFPRVAERDGDDLILADSYVGDRDARSEDRQLLLDALLAATDHLVVTYTGRDERTNLERPPSVPVGELLDLVERTVRPGAPGALDPGALDPGALAAGAPGTGRVRDRIVVHHPLQPFDPRNFRTGALVPGCAWSFDTINLEGAVVREGPKDIAPPFLTRPLPDQTGTALELGLLERFARHPARAFLRERLGVSLGDRAEEIDDALPVELDALAQWAIGDRLLAARLAGGSRAECVAAEQARGLLPPGGLGGPVLRRVAGTVEDIIAAAASATGVQAADSLDVFVELPGAQLVGVVPGVVGDVIRTTMYARLGPAQRLVAWIRLLAVSAAHPGRPFEAVTIGRATTGTGCAIARVGVLAPDAAGRRALATDELSRLVDLLRRGLREPLPMACKASAAWAEGGHDATRTARRHWEGEWNRPGESGDAEHRLVFGGAISFERMLDAAPGPDEQGPHWADWEPTRFGRYAHALWDSLLSREKVSQA